MRPQKGRRPGAKRGATLLRNALNLNTQRIGLAARPAGLMAVGAGLRLGGLKASPALAVALRGPRDAVLPLLAIGLTSPQALVLPAAQRVVVVPA